MGSERALIEERLPHRAPFLFVDRVVAEGPDWVLAEWDVPQDLFAFRGHFPGDPVLPGVLIAEHVFQTAALAIYAAEPQGAQRGTPVLTRIENARFRRIVRPGEVLRTRAEVRERLANARYCAAVVTCAGATVARLECTLALAALEVAP